ncbi:3'-phosphoadenylsulfate reductase [Fusarium solani]
MLRFRITKAASGRGPAGGRPDRACKAPLDHHSRPLPLLKNLTALSSSLCSSSSPSCLLQRASESCPVPSQHNICVINCVRASPSIRFNSPLNITPGYSRRLSQLPKPLRQQPLSSYHTSSAANMPAFISQSSSQSSFQDIKLECESGYVSGQNSEYSSPSSSTILPQVSLTKAHIDHLNNMLETMHPMDILRFCKVMFPNLYQSTAFGLTGLVTMDMLSKIQKEHPNTPTVDLIFLDTLYHFQETHDLVDRVKARYPNVPVHIFKPDGVNTAEEFEDMYGKEMWNTASEMYDWIVKVEPLQRAYEELKVAAVLNGRRRSQGAARGSIPIIEYDDERAVVKINPLATWSFKQVNDYIKEHNVPYNALLDQGYKSVGDWHSTVPVKEGEDERAGRWKGQAKTECGIHNKKSRYAEFLAQMEQKQQEEKLAAALEQVALPAV